jgi:BirA family biotin operon repressor/biotin-[acetyl-CoA-carboxylase] ligase
MAGAGADLDALRERLASGRPPVELRRVAETASTNADLLAEARRPGAATRPCLLVADRQTAGRGRHGRAWHAEPGASLTFSIAWPLAAADVSGLSLAAGVAIAEALAALHAGAAAPPRLGLKWPNDLWLVDAGGAGRKVGGILIETVPQGRGRVAVVGVGLNVLEQKVAGARSGVAWLREIDADATPHSVLERVAPALVEALACFEREGFAAFAERFAALDLLRGQPVRCEAGPGGDAVEGVAEGVSASGDLLVRTARGVERVGSGEVGVRLAQGSAEAARRQPAGSPC